MLIGDAPFLIVGLVEDVTYGQVLVQDTSVFVPYTCVLRRLSPQAAISLMVKAHEPSLLPEVQQQIGDLLERRRGVRAAEFTTSNVGAAVAAYRQGSQTMTVLLAAIAGVSLVVGGIGIMNIMLVSVAERTPEIGVRLAIGTRSRDVQRQFLVEAVILSLSGGALGVLLGCGAAFLVTYLNQWATDITLGAVLGALACSATIGIVFGYYPARRAAVLEPIRALRRD